MSRDRRQQSSPGCRRSFRTAILIAALTLPVCHGAAPAAGADASTTAQVQLPLVKAAIIYNICKFVEWPPVEVEAAEFVIGVYGRQDDGPDFAVLAGKQLHARAVRVVVVTDTAGLAACHAAYVGDPLLAAEAGPFLDRKPILTFSEGRPGRAAGGMIELVDDSDRVRFDVHKTAADRAGLRLSSQLLKLARSVTDD